MQKTLFPDYWSVFRDVNMTCFVTNRLISNWVVAWLLSSIHGAFRGTHANATVRKCLSRHWIPDAHPRLHIQARTPLQCETRVWQREFTHTVHACTYAHACILADGYCCFFMGTDLLCKVKSPILLMHLYVGYAYHMIDCNCLTVLFLWF